MSNERQLPIEVDVHETVRLLNANEPPLLLDCREPFEVEIVSLEGAVTIPMRQIPERVGELEQHGSARLIVFCHHGMRSQQVALWLRSQGFDSAQSLQGGIDAWAATIDPSMNRY